MKPTLPPSAFRNLARKTSVFLGDLGSILAGHREPDLTAPAYVSQPKLKHYRKFRVPKIPRSLRPDNLPHAS